MKYNILIILFVAFFLQQSLGQIRPVGIRFEADCSNDNPIELLSVDQSTTDGNNFPERAIDGLKFGRFNQGRASKTYVEDNPYFQVNLENQIVLSEISIHYPEDLFPEGMGNYYILISDYPFGNANLSESISSQIVEAIYVDNAISSGVGIPLNNKSGKFVRIQLDGNGFIAFTEIELLGIGPGNLVGREKCGNGVDDDCDGRIDCEDNDCSPVFAHGSIVQPSCPSCTDGQILVNVANKRESEVLYSIDNGLTYVEFNRAEEYSPDHLFDNLGDGDYYLVVKNDICEAGYENNPVTLSSPPGIVTSHCENGGFEDGFENGGNGFTNWEGRYGNISFNEDENLRIIEWEDTGFPQNRFSVLSAGQDPFAPISYPYLGNYAARLGTDETKQIDELTYCFIVDEEHVDFNFHFALVVEEPGHDHIEDQPFFQYSVTHVVDGVNQLIPNGLFLLRAETDNPLFLLSGSLGPLGAPIVYTNWSCNEFNLTDFIGEEICVEFVVGGCFLGGHWGYAYLDGICSSDEDAQPNIELNSLNMCEQLLVDASNSYGFTNVVWEVCKFINNEKTNCVLQESISSRLELFDVGDFYSNLGGNFECGNSYSVNLTLDSPCSEPVSDEVIIDYICIDYDFIYKDILICRVSLEPEIDIMMEGENNCGGDCIYEWSPQPLDNPQLEFPTIEGTRNTNAFKQNYNVTITTPEGCNYQEEVKIFNLPPIDLTLIEDMDLCTYGLEANVTVSRPVDVNLINLTFDNLNTGEQFDGVLISDNSDVSFTYQLPVRISKDNPDPYLVQVSWASSVLELNEDILIWGDGCSNSITYTPLTDDRYFGDIEYAIANVLVPNNSNPNNQTFGPIFSDMLNHNVTYGRLRIWDRFGNEVHDEDASSPLDGVPFDMNEIHWDGTNENDELHNSDNFLWILDLRNCDHPDGLGNNQNFCDCTDEEYLNGGCGSCAWKGSFILIR